MSEIIKLLIEGAIARDDGLEDRFGYMKSPLFCPPPLWTLLCVLTLILTPAASMRAQSVWDLGASPATGNWSDATTWSRISGSGTVPVNGDLLTIVDATATTAVTIALNSGDRTLGSLTYGTSDSATDVQRSVVFRSSGTNSPKILTITGDVTKWDSGSLSFRNLATSTGGYLTVNINGNLTLNGGTLAFGNSGQDLYSVKVAGTTTVNSGTLGFYMSSDANMGNLVVNGGQVYLNTSNSLTVNRKVIVSALSGTGGTITDNTQTSSTAPVTLAITGSAATSYSGTIAAGGKSKVAVLKQGSGVQSLDGANTYIGGTTVEAGKLLIGNSTGSGVGTGPVTVQNQATFGGNGIAALSQGNAITVQLGGTIAPGQAAELNPSDTVGTLHLDGGSTTTPMLVMETGATFSFELAAGNSSDRIEFLNYTTGDLTLNNTAINFTGAQEGLYTLFTFYTGSDNTSAAALSEITSGLTIGSGLNGYTSQLIYGANSIQLQVSSVPEPETWAILLLGVAVLIPLARAKRARQSV